MSNFFEKDDSAPVPRARDILCGLLAAVIPVLVIGIYYLADPDFTMGVDDARSDLGSLLVDSCRQLFSGKLPLWSHHSRCGYPLFARGYHGPFYPVHIMAYLIASVFGVLEESYSISHVMHMAIGAVTVYLYLRHLRIRPILAMLGGISFVLSGPAVGFCTNWNNFFFPFVYLPLLFISIDRIADHDRHPFWIFLAGLSGGLILLTGQFHVIFKAFLLALIYLLMRFRRDNWKQLLLRFGAGMTASLLVGAAHITATGTFMYNSMRVGDGPSFKDATALSLVPEHFFNGLIFPILRIPWPSGWINFFPAGAVFIGPMTGISLCAVFYFIRRKGPHRILFAITLIYFLLSLGNAWHGEYLIRKLPVVKQFRWPIRWTIEFALMASILTAVGMEIILKQILRQIRLRQTFYTFLAWVLLVLLLYHQFPMGYFDKGKLLLIAWGIMFFVLFMLFRQKRATLFLRVALVWTVIALAVNIPVAQMLHWSDLRQLYKDPISLDCPKQQRIAYLVKREGQRTPKAQGCFAYNVPHFFQTRRVFGYMFVLRTQTWGADYITHMGEMYNQYQAAQMLRSRLRERLRIGWVVVSAENEKMNQVCAELPDLLLHQKTPWYCIYKNLGFQEPAFFVTGLADNDAQLMKREPATAYALIEPGYAGPRTFAAGGQVSDFNESHDTITFTTSNNADGFVVVTTTMYPGWEAYIDGEQMPLLYANSSFMGLNVPAGAHDVRLVFRPRLLIALIAVSMIVFLLLTVATIWYGLKKVRDA